MKIKLGDTVRIKKTWWPNLTNHYKKGFGSKNVKGTVCFIAQAGKSNLYRIYWNGIGEFGGNWSEFSIELVKKYNHPIAKIFK